MGKKSKILYYTTLVVSVTCFILELLPINFPFFRISFGVTLILLGLMLLVRAFMLKIDSSMFIGVALFCCGIIQIVIYFGRSYNLDQNQMWPYYLFSFALASLCTAIYFKDKLQAKLCVLFLGFGLILLLFVQELITLGWMIGLLVAWFVLYFVTNIILTKRRNRKGQ